MSYVLFSILDGILGKIINLDGDSSYACIGPSRAGKDTLHWLFLMSLVASMPPDTQPTVMRDPERSKVTIVLPGEKKEIIWSRRNYPHFVGEISTQLFDLKPKVIFVIIPYEKAYDAESTEILKELKKVLAGPEYRKMTRPNPIQRGVAKVVKRYPTSPFIWNGKNWIKNDPRGRNKATHIMVCFNKADDIPGDDAAKAEELRKIIKHHWWDLKALEMHVFRMMPVGTCLTEGWYNPFMDLTLKKDFHQLVQIIINDMKIIRS